MPSSYTIYTDGGSRGNPGVAGAGVVIKDGEGNVLKKISEPLGIKTNNFAEYMAVIIALNGLRRIVKKEDRKKCQIEVKMDSELVAKQLSGKYEIKEESLFPLFIQINNIRVTHFPNIVFTHIYREENKEADRLANEAMDAPSEKSLFK